VNVLVFVPYLYDTVPGQRFRIEQWARALGPADARFQFVPFHSERLHRVLHAPGHRAEKAREMLKGIGRRLRFITRLGRDWDVVFLFRELAPVGPPLLERLLVRRGIPVVYDFDDAIYLPNVSDANRGFERLKWVSKTATVCRLATHVTVGNPHLAEYARRYSAHVSVIPTTIDTDSYKPKDGVELQAPPVIGWSGSLSTIKHLRTIEPALRRLRESVDFRLRVVGDRSYRLAGLDVDARGWSAETELDDLRSFDVGLMPLPDDAWSRGKCGLKALQYMAVGVPTIVSPVGVNTEIVQDGRNGFVAGTDDEWVARLRRLLADAALRRRFAEEGRRTVEERYSARSQAPRLLDILEQVRRSSR
jgi:glycosyltransferase involved in cell wall biosynthesis